MKVVVRTTKFLAVGALFMVNHAFANNVRRSTAATAADEEEGEGLRENQHLAAPSSHLRHLVSTSFSSSYSKNDNDEAENFSRFLNIMELLESEPPVIYLDEYCVPSTCPCDKKWFESFTLNAQCEAKKTVEFTLKDSIKPVIECEWKGYTKEQCGGEPIPLDFCDDFDDDGNYDTPDFTVTDNCKNDFLLVVPVLELSSADFICTKETFTRTYSATDGCNDADDVTLNFSVEPPEIVVVLPDTATARCIDDTFPTLTGTQTICEIREAITVDPPAGDPQTCGTFPKMYTYKDKCDITKTKSVQVTVTDTDPPVFSCKALNSCPSDQDVWCPPPAPTVSDKLSVEDCQWSAPKLVTPTQSANPNVCDGGEVKRTWPAQTDGCTTNKNADHVKTFKVKPRKPGAPYRKGDPGCGETPVVCVKVPDCQGIEQERCSDTVSGFVVTAKNSVSTSNICSDDPQSGESSSAEIEKTVTYTDPDTKCTSSGDIKYTVTCCCETAWAVWNTASEKTNCFPETPALKVQRWGWFLGKINKPPSGSTTTEFKIYAAAGQCVLSKGYEAGTATVTYTSTGVVTVEVQAKAPALFTVAHIYVGTEPLPKKNGKYTAAPGQLGYTSPTHSQGTAGEITKEYLGFTGGFIYVAVHTVSVSSCKA
ncbi:hypothetical protein ACA910_005200 [Epithemia clementina (nom. ined.)]